MSKQSKYIKGRGAQINTANPFNNLIYDEAPIDWEQAAEEPLPQTQYIKVEAKTILNKVKSPDIGMGWSMNPYQGCEHGCVYCYARNTHPYWGYSAGLEFEQKILVKHNAPKLLEQKLKSPKWKASAIMFSGNTDCYQPIEKELKITRQLLEVLWKYRHPAGMITKNSLILRDLDILKQMAAQDLVHVSISVTTLDEKLRQLLEPRTASVKNRLKTIRILAKNGIPVNVMMAPIIPSMNDHEIMDLVKTVAEAGATTVHYTVVRLNGDIAAIFKDWLEKTYPDRAAKVLNKIEELHGGNLYDHRIGKRMSGEGNLSEIIRQQFRLARKKYLTGVKLPSYNFDLHEQFKSPQLKLF